MAATPGEGVGPLSVGTHAFAMISEATGIAHLTGGKIYPLPGQLAPTNAPSAETKHSAGNTPTEWLTGVNTRDKGQSRPPSSGDDLAFYGHRIPVIGPLILGVDEKSQSHPRLTRILEAIDPALGKGPANRQLLRGTRK